MKNARRDLHEWVPSEAIEEKIDAAPQELISGKKTHVDSGQEHEDLVRKANTMLLD